MSDADRPLPAEEDIAWVSDESLRGFFGYQMKRSFNVIQADLARTLKPFELRMLTFTALALVVENPGLRQSQLAEAMDIERPNLVVIVEELVRRGLIARNKVPTDRRANALQATPAGRVLCTQATEAVKAHEAALLTTLDARMLAAAFAAMKRIEASAAR